MTNQDTASPVRQSQVQVSYSRLTDEITNLDDIMRVLEQKLTSVLRDNPTEVQNSAVPLEQKVPLASDLDCLSLKIEALVSRAKSMMQNLEL